MCQFSEWLLIEWPTDATIDHQNDVSTRTRLSISGAPVYFLFAIALTNSIVTTAAFFSYCFDSALNQIHFNRTRSRTVDYIALDGFLSLELA